mmetsp:Transcript_25237/g.80680  ORF Transcript_25237/g.80680 Transcript_25237/m.80680 type:complete len:444 (+) Transcript_25237:533-1864(+)
MNSQTRSAVILRYGLNDLSPPRAAGGVHLAGRPRSGCELASVRDERDVLRDVGEGLDGGALVLCRLEVEGEELLRGLVEDVEQPARHQHARRVGERLLVAVRGGHLEREDWLVQVEREGEDHPLGVADVGPVCVERGPLLDRADEQRAGFVRHVVYDGEGDGVLDLREAGRLRRVRWAVVGDAVRLSVGDVHTVGGVDGDAAERAADLAADQRHRRGHLLRQRHRPVLEGDGDGGASVLRRDVQRRPVRPEGEAVGVLHREGRDGRAVRKQPLRAARVLRRRPDHAEELSRRDGDVVRLRRHAPPKHGDRRHGGGAVGDEEVVARDEELARHLLHRAQLVRRRADVLSARERKLVDARHALLGVADCRRRLGRAVEGDVDVRPRRAGRLEKAGQRDALGAVEVPLRPPADCASGRRDDDGEDHAARQHGQHPVAKRRAHVPRL